MPQKPSDLNGKLPFRTAKYRNLKEALRHAVYSRPDGKTAEVLAMEAGLDRLSDLSRYLGDGQDETRGKFLDIFIPLLIALGPLGIEVWEYIGQELRAAQEKYDEKKMADVAGMLCDLLPPLIDYVKAQGKKK